MFRITVRLVLVGIVALCLLTGASFAQQASAAAGNAVVPLLVNYGGLLLGADGKPQTGTVGVTFALYASQEGGSPLWLETQNVRPDKTGHYSVQLGAANGQGLPTELFAAGQARWLGVQAQGEAEQARTLLMSVPYALKALDAETIGGKPLSALQLALPSGGSRSNQNQPQSQSQAQPNGAQANAITCASSTACKNTKLVLFASSGGPATVKDSIITQSNGGLQISGDASFSEQVTAKSTSSSAALVGTDTGVGGIGGVKGSSTNGAGVVGTGATGVSGSSSGGPGVAGSSTNGTGVYGVSTNSYGVLGNGITGVLAEGEGEDGIGVNASGNLGIMASGNAAGVYSTSESSTGVIGISSGYIGVYGAGTTGVYGISGIGSTPTGVYAQASAGGWAVDAVGTGGATGVLAGSDTGYAAWFNGDANVDGTLTANTKKFKIDDPLDPANKYLEHASVESSELMNIYTGNITTDANGEATVQLPKWFEALNTDFRYQLTVVGQFAQAIISRKIANRSFQIRTNAPNVEVSWQVTGVRQDAYAKAHPMQVEYEKPEIERGFYQHPELYGQPEEKGILWGRSPETMKRWKAARNGQSLAPMASRDLNKR
ncbi:MAG TPA: hypothetical protein VF753_04030 [Terriglobales bacterium]